MSEAPDAFQQEMTLEEDDGFSRLVEMGFGREEDVKAMRAEHNDAERAVETGVPGGQGQAASEPGGGEEMIYNDSDYMHGIFKEYVFFSAPHRTEERAKAIGVSDSMTHYTLLHT